MTHDRAGASRPVRGALRATARPRALLALLAFVAAAPARAQDTAAGASPESAAEPARVAPDSPRAALTRFLEVAAQGRWLDAAKFLDLPPGADGPQLAERLKAVLDHQAAIDPELVSPLATGQTNDGLPPWTDEVVELAAPDGQTAALRMVRREDSGGGRWLFSRGTVRRIDGWYDELPDRWLRDVLPEPLLRPGPQGLFWWQWLGLPLLGLAAWVVGRLLCWLTLALIRRIARRTKATWDDSIAERLGGPVTLGWALGLIYVLLPWLLLPRSGELFVRQALSAGFFLVFFWTLARSVVVVGDAIRSSAWGKSRPGSAGLVGLVVKSAKIVVLFIAVIAVLAQFGYPVASLLAGLGIGGLVIALAAQKTLENLFGSVAIGVDQPFRPGDFVRIDDLTGTVDSIGLRSTRIRTLDRTLVTIPNGKLADQRIETYAARDRIRLSCLLGLSRGTTAGQLRAALSGIETALRTQPKLWTEELVVRFVKIGDSSLDVEVMAWFTTTRWDEFLAIRQEVLLGFLEAVERAGTALAFPVREIHTVAKA
jgi:MscS family membrane protein